MNQFIICKLLAYLSNKEGCSIQTLSETNVGAVAEVQDAFGFRYQVVVRPIGRKGSGPNDLEVQEIAAKSNYMGLSKA